MQAQVRYACLSLSQRLLPLGCHAWQEDWGCRCVVRRHEAHGQEHGHSRTAQPHVAGNGAAMPTGHRRHRHQRHRQLGQRDQRYAKLGEPLALAAEAQQWSLWAGW